jgi:hypothetical protein
MGLTRGGLLALVAVAVSAGPAQSLPVNVCTLISPGVIEKTLGEPVQSTKPTSQILGELQLKQCFYALPTFTNSINVTLTAPSPADVHHDAARQVWDRWFHHAEADKDDSDGDARAPRKDAEEEEATAKAEPVAGLGDEAFWVRSFVGNLYVRKGDQFLRISIGGKQTADQRLAKAKQLASDALKHMP